MITAEHAREIVRSMANQEKIVKQCIHDEMLKCDELVRRAAEHGKLYTEYITPSTYGIHTLADSSRKLIKREIAELLRRRGYDVYDGAYDIQIYWYVSNKVGGD